MAADRALNYDEDPRTPCKYGEKCYQKNPNHHAKFKHPDVSKGNTRTKELTEKKRKHAEEDESESLKTSKKERLTTDSTDKCESTATTDDAAMGADDDNKLEEFLPASPQSVEESIKQKFLTEMPKDFYSFWEFCKSLDSSHPETALLSDTGLQLVGPFDVLSGKLKSLKPRKQSAYLAYCRYYYDPPEFQTVIKGSDKSQYHMGYFRDVPAEMPVFVAENEAAKNCTIKPMGENLFSAINAFVESKKARADKTESKKLGTLATSLQQWAKKSNFNLDQKTPKMKARDKKVVTKSFHGAGIVVPYDKKTEAGYRPLPDSNANLKKMLQKIIDCETQSERDKHFDNLQEIITLIQFANDECDYGMGLELALDLFSFGDPYFHKAILFLLPLAYEFLKRPEFAIIIKAHLCNRQKLLRIT